MNVFFSILVGLIVFASILLTIVVLLQNGKGEGIATNFTAANKALGVRESASLLEKATWGLVAFILVLSIVSTFTLSNNAEGTSNDDISTEILNQSSDEAPAFPGVIPQGDPTAVPEEPLE